MSDKPGLAALYREHGTSRRVADALGCSQSWAYKILKRAGVKVGKQGPRAPRLSPAEYQRAHREIISDLERGLKLREVAGRRGVSFQRVHQIAQRAGIRLLWAKSKKVPATQAAGASHG